MSLHFGIIPLKCSKQIDISFKQTSLTEHTINDVMQDTYPYGAKFVLVKSKND